MGLRFLQTHWAFIASVIPKMPLKHIFKNYVILLSSPCHFNIVKSFHRSFHKPLQECKILCESSL